MNRGRNSNNNNNKREEIIIIILIIIHFGDFSACCMFPDLEIARCSTCCEWCPQNMGSQAEGEEMLWQAGVLAFAGFQAIGVRGYFLVGC